MKSQLFSTKTEIEIGFAANGGLVLKVRTDGYTEARVVGYFTDPDDLFLSLAPVVNAVRDQILNGVTAGTTDGANT